MTNPGAARSPTPPQSSALSLERKLPLLMTAVLVAGLAAALIATYGTLTRNAESSARERLSRTVAAVGASIEAALRVRTTAAVQVAKDPALRAALSRPEDSAAITAAATALEKVRTPTDSAFTAELWDGHGRRIASVGMDVPARERDVALPLLPVERAPARDSVRWSPLHQSGQRVFLWGATPIWDGEHLVGWLAQRRRVAGSPDANRSLRGLTGEEVTLYTHNVSGDLWVSISGDPHAAPQSRDSAAGGVTHVRPEGRYLAVEARAAGTPWVVAIESPVTEVYSRSRRTISTLAALSLVITVLGALASWAISRRITKPLAALTTAAEAVARGARAHPVTDKSGDEIGRLATSFNEMADEVAASRTQLEVRVAETQASAEALARTNQDLKAAVNEADQARRDALAAQADAEHANRAKSDFLAVMSHELRTPLNAIGGYAQLLAMELHGPVTEQQRESLARIERSQARLLALINDVLNFAKLDAGKVSYAITDVPVSESLAGVEMLVTPQVRSKDLSFSNASVDSRLTVQADRDKLEQVILNLLTNAIKFTLPGGKISIECFADERIVTIVVRDTGVGISSERMPLIFEPFVQATRTLSNPSEGVGLGLAISRDLARAMSGDITVKSMVTVGSEFTLTLPRGQDIAGSDRDSGRSRQQPAA